MPSDSIIYDIGASVGTTTAIFESYNVKVIAVEPAPKNYICLSARFSQNYLINIVPDAVSNEVGESTLYHQSQGNTLHTLSKKWKDHLTHNQQNRWKSDITFEQSSIIKTTTLDTLIGKYGIPYFIKIDVEGLEWKVIQGLNQSIPIISFEANLPEFLEETILCIDRLSKINKKTKFNYSDGLSIVLPNDINKENFIAIIKNTKLRYLDVICRY